MTRGKRGFGRGIFRQQQGSIAVEMAIIIPVFLLLVFGIVDFGHAWYMRHVMSNASREGARYGTRFVTDASGNRVLPKNLSPTIPNYVKNSTAENSGKGGFDLKTLLPADSNPNVTAAGPGATETNSTVLPIEDLSVTVTARKNWFVIGALIPGMGNHLDLTVTTTMKCE